MVGFGGRGLGFGQVAGFYDRGRPSYPDGAFQQIATFCGIDSPRVLEVGAGTGKATEPAARRGFEVLAVEPSAAMAAVLASRCASYPRVAVVVSTFEDLEVEPAGFDVVMSAQAWHWVSRDVRHRKARAVLRPGGTLALLWTHPRWDQCAVAEDLVEVYHRFAPELTGCGPWFPGFTDEAGAERPTADELAGLFGPITEHRYPWTESYDAGTYIDLVRSLVEHDRLATECLDRLVEAIAQIIRAAGGTIDVSYQTRLYLTRAIAP